LRDRHAGIQSRDHSDRRPLRVGNCEGDLLTSAAGAPQVTRLEASLPRVAGILRLHLAHLLRADSGDGKSVAGTRLAASTSAGSSSRPRVASVTRGLAQSPRRRSLGTPRTPRFRCRSGTIPAVGGPRLPASAGLLLPFRCSRSARLDPATETAASRLLQQSGRAGEAAALVLATQEFVANGGRRPSCRHRRSAAFPGRTDSRCRVGRRGSNHWWSQWVGAPPERPVGLVGCRPSERWW
jgi:hypothetical protein